MVDTLNRQLSDFTVIRVQVPLPPPPTPYGLIVVAAVAVL